MTFGLAPPFVKGIDDFLLIVCQVRILSRGYVATDPDWETNLKFRNSF